MRKISLLTSGFCIKKHGDIDSIVPVLVYSRGMTVQQAIADTTKELQLNVDRFDQIASDLLAEVKSTSPDQTDDVASYILGCRYNQMANLLWRYVQHSCSSSFRANVFR